ncbi:alcohol dehydrogenase [Ktedonosporobacter rubrisoli]|uniref:Alcohol dehydrogenase n=1 Tax=Ktedonosporobacter rubrisoli TaxID=2509675 RepID=A0A4P6JXK8_KTERU|nr:glutathione-independent formaldehyde dehydrogenase [Ktedonosporobacter rubrisoli]QBD80374.1 alcohol dehydrogenase [Ktedonosporobacter rubrisoli]
MKAVVWRGDMTLNLESVEDARIEAPTDVLMRVTSSAICGTDLHIYEGRMGEVNGLVIGHEPLGVVAEVGPAVASIKQRDRIVVPTHICCGFCYNCVRGYSASCLMSNPGSAGAAYGYPGMGTYRGAQTELVRIPFADANCLRLPGEPGDDLEHDFVLLADAFPTGYHATELAQVSTGDSVAIFGAGAIGLLAAYASLLRGASEVFVVDYIPERLAKAGELGASPIDFRLGDPVEQILEQRGRKRKRAGSTWRGEDSMGGVNCGIDAIGFQARDRANPEREKPDQVIHDLARVINPNGRLAIAGVFLPNDAKPVGELAKHGDLAVPWQTLFKKSITIGMGRDNDERYNTQLRDMIIAGRARPGQIVSHRLPLSQAPEAFKKFDTRTDGYIKVVLDPAI